MGVLIAAGVLTLLAIMPVGVRICYDAGGFLAKLLIGPATFVLYPREKKPKGKEKTKKTAKKSTKSSSNNNSVNKENGGSLADFRGILAQVLEFLGEFRRRLIVKQLDLKLVLAGDDPCDLACNYGNTWVAIGNLLPVLEKVFTIKKRNIDVSCNFCAEQITVVARLDIVICLGRLLWIVVIYGIRIFGEYLKMKKLRKGGN